MKDQTEPESEILQWLDVIKPVPPRDAQAARRTRAAFLSQAVSASELPRHKGWKTIFKKEQFAMKMLISIFLIASLLFGGAVTVNAAQNDLPDEPLYNLKLWSEDLSLEFQNNSEERVDRLMELAQVRLQEMAQINDAGKAVPDQVRLRFEQHIQQALQTCSVMDDAAMDRTLLRVRDHLQEQDRDMERLQLRIHQDSQPALERTRQMLQLRLQLVNDGLLDHEIFRNAARNGFRHRQNEQCGPGQCTTPVPTNTSQQHAQPTRTPNGPNTEPGGPNTDPGGPNPDSGGANATPVGPNMTPGGPDTSPGGNNPDGGGNMNGPGSGSGNDSDGSGGNGPGGNDSGGGMGGNGSGGDGSGGGPGGNRP
ncbi:MAG TPA: DUF5667 domain-containing protein [Anaerolineales bacterium]|nr:DUF5667 domain-containing protein [Anaerolineales bacterium]